MLDLECKQGFRSKLMLSLSAFGILSLLLCGYTVGSSYLSVSGHGDWGLPSQELVLWLCVLCMIIVAVSLVGLIFNKIRCTSMAVLIGSGLMVTLSIVSLKSADGIRLQGFERLSQEAAPLVAAIHAYNMEFGHPPKTLDMLQVNYPPGYTIKGGELPDFEYLPGYIAIDRYHGNPWVLMLETPTGPLRWDKFLYYPLQNYPPLGHGGWFEKVGEWAYVHE
ncbi:MAG: hypothetical protein DRH08_08205 [Deltaproteobacteria bacterium]|nr:MAG: hypothetical protein DRH08_08205 [Deltaproteobacteria bacterium]